jgi:hypothetical protein
MNRARTYRWPIRLLLIALLLASSVVVSSETATAGPTVLKRTLRIGAGRISSYWRDKNADSPEWNTWSWLPRIYFEVYGPIEGGGQISVEYTLPNGKPWYTHNLATEELGAGRLGAVQTDFRFTDAQEKLATLETGVFGYTIRLTNELTGANETLLKGKFTVRKVHVGIAQRPNEFEYYVDQDWRLPLGSVWLNLENDEDAPPLYVGLWMRGNAYRLSDMAAYLFHNGKQVASTKVDSWSGLSFNADFLTISNRDQDPSWRHLLVEFNGVRRTNDNDHASELHYLDQNPGDYEMKVLHDGKLVRTVKFSIGADGQIVDPGVGTEERPSGTRYLVPVKITGDVDGKWDQNAWKTEMYYGNVYAGFTALPVGAN